MGIKKEGTNITKRWALTRVGRMWERGANGIAVKMLLPKCCIRIWENIIKSDTRVFFFFFFSSILLKEE